MRIYATLAFVLAWIPSSLFSAEVYEIAPEPAWAEPVKVEKPTSVPEGQVEGGSYYLLVDETSRVQPRETFHHSALLILNEAGVQSDSEIAISVSPSYESLKLHRADVLRDGVWTSRLKPDLVSVLHRENEMEDYMVNGGVTVVIRLKDVRVGDVLRFSYTKSGEHPAFRGVFYRSFLLGYSGPVAKIRQRVILSPKLPIFSRSHGGASEPTRKQGIWEWEVENAPAVIAENNIPRSEVIYPFAEVGSMSEWSEVVEWALPLYVSREALGPELEAEIARLRTLPTAEEKTAAALRVVQDQIRYMAVATGVHSHQPRLPREVFSNKLGDCKEKVLLLASMLRSLEITCYPVLVSSAWGSGVAALLPSANAFDHVILEVQINGESYFLDPTRTCQRGPLRKIFISHFGYGLRLAEGETNLIPVEPRAVAYGTSKVTSDFVCGDLLNTKPTTLTVTTKATGSVAEFLRAAATSTSLRALTDRYLSFYTADYPSIQSAHLVSFQDDEATNTVRVVESYTIPQFWNQRTTNSAVFNGQVTLTDISNRMQRPGKTQRQWDVALERGLDIHAITTLKLPKDWSQNHEKKALTNAWFDLQYSSTTQGNMMMLEAKYRTLSPRVLASDVADYSEQVQSGLDLLGRSLTYTLPTSQPPARSTAPLMRVNWLLLASVLTAILVSGVCGLLLCLPRRRPPLLPNPAIPPHLRGLSGWLIVLGLLLLLYPCVILVSSMMTNLPLLADAYWQAVLQKIPEDSRVLATWLTNTTAAWSAVQCLIGVGLLVLFFLRRRSFPLVFGGFLTLNLIVVYTCLLLGSQQTGQPQTYYWNAAILAFIQAGIWVPYVILSRRVRATFTF